MGREALHGALRELISVAVLWYEDDLLASDQGDAVNVVHGVLLGGRQYRAAYDLWNLRDHSVAALLKAVCPFGNPIAHSYIAGMIRPVDRKSVGEGKSVSVRVYLDGGRNLK